MKVYKIIKVTFGYEEIGEPEETKQYKNFIPALIEAGVQNKACKDHAKFYIEESEVIEDDEPQEEL